MTSVCLIYIKIYHFYENNSYVYISLQVFANLTQLTMSSQSSASFSIASAGATGVHGGNIMASFVELADNLYPGGDVASPLVGLTLLDGGSHSPLDYTEGMVTVQIPLSTNEALDPSCEFWDESLQQWSEEGCELTGYYPEQGYILCNCTHLTTFSCPLIPPILIPEWTNLTWANLVAEPTGVLVLLAITGAAFLASLWGRAHDRELDRAGIAQTYKLLEREHMVRRPTKPDASSPQRVKTVQEKRQVYSGSESISCASVQRWLGKRGLTGFNVLLKKHSWVSVYGRHPMSTVGSVDRVWILYSCVLISAALSAMFVEVQGVEEAAGAWIWCCFVSMLVMLIQYKLCFQPKNQRFHDLFLAAAEEVAMKRQPVLAMSHPPSSRQVIFRLLADKLQIEPGCANWRFWLTWALMSYKYINDSIIVDFRHSKYSFVRAHGFELLRDVSVETLVEKWQQQGFLANPRRVFGYAITLVLSAGTGVVLLVYMLQFQLASDPTSAQELYVVYLIVSLTRSHTYIHIIYIHI